MQADTAKTDREAFSLTQIPCHALVRLGAVFREGEVKYGRGNWRHGVGDRAYQLERANHALKHLLWYVHRLETGEEIGEGEDNVGRVMWWCATQMELERLEAQPSAGPPCTPPQTIRYDQLSESQRDHIRYTHEPGGRWYYWMGDRTLVGQRGHEWERWEQRYAAELAAGELRRVVLPEEMQP